MDLSFGRRSTAKLIKLPTDAPIAKPNKINMRLSFPKNQANVDDEVLNWKVVGLIKWGNEFPNVAPEIRSHSIGHLRLPAYRRAT